MADLTEVTKYTRLFLQADMARVIAVIDAASPICASGESTTLAAMLIAKCRAHGLQNGPIGEMDFKLYAIGLAEAFAKFPANVGMQAVDGGTGLPSKSPFWPKPFDIVQFCNEVMAKRGRAKVMAQRHLDEAKRRADEHNGGWQEPTPEQKARVQAMVERFHRGIKSTELASGWQA